MRLCFTAIFFGTLFGALQGCTQFPELDNVVDTSDKTVEFPTLVPLENLLTSTGTPQITPETQSNIEARVARLKRRAAQLRARNN